MCGIAGFASSTAAASETWLSRATAALRHRGPDGEGTWASTDGRVGFGHRRLAIIDLSAAANQPMLFDSGRLCVILNGEIYNFREVRRELSAKGHTFRTQSDTEVILAAYWEWGVECVSRLRGMFAIALYDRDRQQVFFARDRAGEKPLYYRVEGQGIYFASELKALLLREGQNRRVSPDALDCYLAFGFVPGDRSLIDGIAKLPPAHAMLFELNTGRLRSWRYWSPPPSPSPYASIDEPALQARLEGLLEEAVGLQLEADVPVGVLLSGGVDSSLIAAMASRKSKSLKAFTIRFPNQPQHDETEHARLVANHFGLEHVELEAEPQSVEVLPLLARQFDDPIIDSSMVPTYFVSRLVRGHCTVALGGDGGDELFGGYSAYRRLMKYERVINAIPLAFRAPLGRAANALLPVGFRGRAWARALGENWRTSVPSVGLIFDDSARRSVVRRRSTVAEEIQRARTAPVANLLGRVTRYDFENYLAEDILVKVDRASMLCSLEVRAPFLDHHVIEFAFGEVPASLKADPNGQKILLKQLARRILPFGFDFQRKQGFSIPLDKWLGGSSWQEYFRSVLLDPSQTVFDHRSIERMLRGQPRLANGERLFGLAMFELWRREYSVSL